MYSRLLVVVRWRSFGKSRFQQEIRAICSGRSRMMRTVLSTVISCSSMTYELPGNNWRFWYYHFLIVPNIPIISGTISVLTSHILLTSISRSLHLLSFLVSFVLIFESVGVPISISGQVLSFLSRSAKSVRFAYIVRSVITGMSHIIVAPLTFMTLSGTLS
jgi:hypothetical protein